MIRTSKAPSGRKTTAAKIAALLALTTSSAWAGDVAPLPSESSVNEAFLLKAEQRLQATFTNFEFEDFEPGPWPGSYQVSANGRVIYYMPESDLLVFGSVWNTDGQNLTALETERRRLERLEGLDFSVGLTIGDEDGLEVIEFTNPDCPWCRRLDEFFRAKQAEGHKIKRKIVFTTAQGRSKAKALSILCSEDQEAAFARVYRGGVLEPTSCPEGREMLDSHISLSGRMGVTGTPSLLLGGEFHTGFPESEILAFLQSNTELTQ